MKIVWLFGFVLSNFLHALVEGVVDDGEVAVPALLPRSSSPSLPCPLFCDCFFANASVVCSMHDGHFPADLPSDTQSLSLRPSSNKIRFLFLHNFFASSSPTYPYLRSFELRLEAAPRTTDRTKIRIHQGAFSRSRFPMLENFALNGGAVLSLAATFLQDAPALVSLDLHDLLINELQPDTFMPVGSSLELLNLSSNSIRKLDNNTFTGLAALMRLDLSYNQISTIHSHAFSELTRLAELYLQGNLITTLGLMPGDPSPPIFPSSLSLLDLSKNSRVYGFGASIFWPARAKLSILRLNELPLNMSRQQLMDALTPLAKTLKVLELDRSISSQKLISARTFRGFHFERLSLVGNELTSLEFVSAADVFIESLLVDDNNLTCLCVPNGTINRSIKFLSATRNNITTLSDVHMRAFPAIRFLNLSMNTLRSINDSAFSSLSLLNVLDLSNNSLQELPRTAFLASSFPQTGITKPTPVVTISAPLLVVPRLSQVKLRVHGNPFHCNADLLWLKELYDRSYERQFNANDPPEFPVNEPSCASPYPPAPFSKLTQANFRSFHPTARILNGAKNFTATEGESLNLTCEVFGDPSPRVIWRISPDRETIFHPVNIGERRRVVQILLTNVQKVNEGMVTCLAINRVGSHAAATHVFVAAARLSWESVIDITLTAFVSCFVAVVLIALVVWACITRRRRHTRLIGRSLKSSDESSGRSVASNASSRQPSKSPSTSTGAESLLAFDEKSSQKHLHRLATNKEVNGLPEEEPSQATLLAATDGAAAGVVSPSGGQQNGTFSNRNGHSNGFRAVPTGPLLILEECSTSESTTVTATRSTGGYVEGSLLLKTASHKEVVSAAANKPRVPSKNNSSTRRASSVNKLPAPPQQNERIMAKRVKLVASTLTPRVVKI